jgi:hypothetical protein
VTSSSLRASPEEARKALEKFLAAHPQAAGWVCWAGRLEVIMPGRGLADSGEPALSAELCDGPVSWHLRQSGHGYSATEITECPSTPAGSVLTEQTFLSVRSAPGALRYQVCWQPRPARVGGQPAAFEPVLSRFAGFTSPSTQTP